MGMIFYIEELDELVLYKGAIIDGERLDHKFECDENSVLISKQTPPVNAVELYTHVLVSFL